jgi:hypothetical protein
MDLSLARALDQLRDAAHQVDPRTPVGIEGTQMPHAFGGYDLWRLSRVLDWIEPYDIGNAREILGSFMPNKPIVTTVFESDTNHALRRLWHLLLEGDRGCIIWWSEDSIDWKTEDYQLTAKARALAPALKEMTSPLAQLFLRAEREYDPVYIHYSQPSIQVDWLLESTVDGSTWLRRFSSYEADHNHMARVRNGWLKVFQDLGYSPRFISSEELASGIPARRAGATLVLPTSWALSEKEMAVVQGLLKRPESDRPEHTVFSDVTPGLFDGHGRLRKENVLSGLFPTVSTPQCRAAQNVTLSTVSLAGDMGRFPAERPAKVPAPGWAEWVGKQMKLKPEILVNSAACVRSHRYRLGSNRLVAFERNVDYHMSEELKQAGGNERLEQAIEVEAVLEKPAHVYDLRKEKYLGRLDKVRFALDPWQPSLFALTNEQLPAGPILKELSKN